MEGVESHPDVLRGSTCLCSGITPSMAVYDAEDQTCLPTM